MGFFAIQLVPGSDAEPFDQVITLDGSRYLFRFRWGGRAGAWLLAIHDDQDVELIAGLALVNCSDLLRPYNDERLPPGQISVVDVDDTGIDAGVDDLGGRVQLFYVDLADVESTLATLA